MWAGKRIWLDGSVTEGELVGEICRGYGVLMCDEAEPGGDGRVHPMRIGTAMKLAAMEAPPMPIQGQGQWKSGCM